MQIVYLLEAMADIPDVRLVERRLSSLSRQLDVSGNAAFSG